MSGTLAPSIYGPLPTPVIHPDYSSHYLDCEAEHRAHAQNWFLAVLKAVAGFGWGFVYIWLGIMANTYMVERADSLRALGMLPPIDWTEGAGSRGARKRSNSATEMNTPRLVVTSGGPEADAAELHDPPSGSEGNAKDEEGLSAPLTANAVSTGETAIDMETGAQADDQDDDGDDDEGLQGEGEQGNVVVAEEQEKDGEQSSGSRSPLAAPRRGKHRQQHVSTTPALITAKPKKRSQQASSRSVNSSRSISSNRTLSAPNSPKGHSGADSTSSLGSGFRKRQQVGPPSASSAAAGTYIKLYQDGVFQFYFAILVLCMLSSVLLMQGILTWSLTYAIKSECYKGRTFNSMVEVPLAVLQYYIAFNLLETLYALSDGAYNRPPTHRAQRKRRLVIAFVVVMAIFVGFVVIPPPAGARSVFRIRTVGDILDVLLSLIVVIASIAVGIYIPRVIEPFATERNVLKVRVVTGVLAAGFIIRGLYEIPGTNEGGYSIQLGSGDDTMTLNFGDSKKEEALIAQLMINFIPVSVSMFVLRRMKDTGSGGGGGGSSSAASNTGSTR